MMRVAITGAGGFLGRALVARAGTRGHSVLALTRDDVDLGAAEAVATLTPMLAGVDVLIHAAASFAGDAAAHARDTRDATAHLIAAMQAQTAPPRLVLVSSLSVYDIPALPDHATLSEDSPVITDGPGRDAYARAKAKQERQVAASGLDAGIVRVGAIYGPGRLWSAQLGFARGGVVICPGGAAEVPAIALDHAAAGLIRAAEVATDTPVNLIYPDPPTQMQWLSALGLRTVRVPRGLVLAAGGLLGRGAKWQARFRPLRHDTTRAETLLAGLPRTPFGAAIAAVRDAERAAR